MPDGTPDRPLTFTVWRVFAGRVPPFHAESYAVFGEMNCHSAPAAVDTVDSSYLQTLVEIGVEHNSTIIFPVPVDILEGLAGMMKMKAGRPVAPDLPAPTPNGGASLPTTPTAPPTPPTDSGQSEG